ncbi:penicillin-binding protein 1A [Thiothrix eikelboomii]|uniref:penicillin-binding protein 1A n=1 Tax=Thiothrix eikelboomii TaxID=92487 RepID=UPI003BAF7ED9
MRFFIHLITFLLSSLLSLSTVGLAILAGLYFIYSPQLPNSEDLRKIDIQVPLRIYSRDERLIAEYGEKRSRPVNFNAIPERLRQAFIAIEDARYYEHQGIDPKGVARALYNVIATGRKSQGASTITMQLARNAFLDNDKTLARKFKETLLAIRLEQTLSKDEILELYLNKIFLGNRAYGIAAAAETYYGKQLDDLTLAEMAMIAGLPKAPSRYNPIVNEPRAMTRRNYILQRMAEQGFITLADYKIAVKQPNTASVHKPDIETYAPYLAEMVRAAIVEKYQDKAYTQGYDVYTTLDSEMQTYATDALRTTLENYDRRHGYRGAEDHINLEDYSSQDELLDKLSNYQQVGDLQAGLVLKSTKTEASVLLMNETVISLSLADVKWANKFITANRRGSTPKRVSDVIVAGDIIRVRPLKSTNKTEPDPTNGWQFTQIPTVGGALVLMDPHNGAIRAVMGGYDFYYSKFNRATQAMRQPGSSFKPIIYSAALSRGFAPTSIVNDAPISIPGSNWQPKNFGGSYIGPTTLSEALAKSRNLVSIRLLRDTGIPYTINYATRFGFSREHLPPNLTLALGTGLTTPVQMATTYAAFANGGFKVDAHFINRIQDSNGQVLFDATTETRQVCGDDIKLCPIRKPKPTQSEPTAATQIADNLDPTKTDNKGTDNKDKKTSADAKLAALENKDYDTEPGKIAPAAVRIIDSRTQHQIVTMMQGVTQFGTAAAVNKTLHRSDIAGKTGTTNEQRDSWFCGFTPDYVAVAWSGFDDMAELGEGETSGKVAVPMWIGLMQQVLKNAPEKKFKKLDKLQMVKIDAKTGLLADDTSAEVIEEKLVAQPEAAKPARAKTENFEFTSAATESAPPTATHQPTQRPAPVRKREAVEIPEQIF